MKNKTFSTLAEALEAGEPLIADKIIGETDSLNVYAEAGENFSNFQILKVDKAYKTMSGAYVILARHRTPEEEAEKVKRHKQTMDDYENEDKDRIATVMKMTGYILIGWHSCPCNSSTNMFDSSERLTALYLPETGPRYVYKKAFWKVYSKPGKGKRGYYTAQQENEKEVLKRDGRNVTASHIKKYSDRYTLRAPIWLLTSIPDPRPRYLFPEGENTGPELEETKTIKPSLCAWGNTAAGV